MKKSVLAALLVFSPAVWSADVFVGPQIGSFGYGAELGVDFDKLTVRGLAGKFDYDETDTFDDVRYDLDGAQGSLGLVLDYHVFGGGFFLSAGVFNNEIAIDALGTPIASTVIIGDVEYNTNQVGSLLADVEFGGASPYAGLGWDFGRKDKGFALSLEAGAIFNGEGDAELLTVGGDPLLTNSAAFQAELRKEEEELNDDLDALEIIPVLKLGLRYYF